jgi:hypothetical protein
VSAAKLVVGHHGIGGARITIFTKLSGQRDLSGSLLSKRIALVDGRVVSDGSPCRMASGDAEIAHVPTAFDLAKVIAAMGSANALALGCIKNHKRARVVTARVLARLAERKMPDSRPIITRCREHIDYETGAAWLLIDFDNKGMPAEVSVAIAAAGGVWQALVSIAPGLAHAARVSRTSTSAGLRRSDTGEEIAGSGGEHHNVLVKDGTDIDRALKTLHDLCWLHGFGWYRIGKAGQLLDRSIVDVAVRFGERLVFEGPPEVVPPLMQDAAARMPIPHDGQAIDTRSVIPALTEYELARVREAKARARIALEPRAAEVKAAADRRLAEAISKRTGMPFVAAVRAVASRHHGSLSPPLMLDFDDLGFVSVEAVLADPDRFIGETLADPLEGAGYGRDKAMVLRSKTDSCAICISSFAHGGAFYQLRHDARTARAAVEAADPQHVVDVLCAVVPHADIEADELSGLIATVAKQAKVGVRAIQARLRAEQARRDAAKRKAAQDHRIALDKRLVYPLPPSDGERGPIIRLVDETLAADQSAEPPMRDAAGNLVEVRTIKPWGLHLLTATGSNADAAVPKEGDGGDVGNDFGLPAPAEPAIVRLSPVEVELLIEQHIRFETQATEKKPSYAAALQQPFIKALMAIGADRSMMPVGRAVNTAPLVAINGAIITGVGLDRSSGLIHRIEPQLLACLPATPPTEEEVRRGLRWLLDEWLVDVNADLTGKLLVIMMCLSLIERVLLKERPAWFVRAGHRGGGKTTLVHMIIMAIFGRMAAAAAWSDSEEERRKALFAYLREAVAALCWDNIPRGAQISSACIEKALTGPEVSDRVLGESVFETAPGGTVQIFTGNSIAPKGDMVSRSFSIVINVDRPDPENREFAHPDPMGWTARHRRQILSCLYTILVYGCQNRPAGQVAKTRFKDWWSLCGWPVEHAVALIGENIDCLALLNAGESDDDETAAAATMLSTLRAEFGARPFGAGEIVKLIEAGTASVWTYEPPAERGKAERLLDAFSEMLGRQLNRPTAGTLGKLLNNRLVDRPTRISASIVATLKTFKKDNTGLYEVSLTCSGDGSNYATSDPAGGQTMSRMSLISPHAGRPAGDRGDAGHVSSPPAPASTENDDDISDVPPGEEFVV